jgi:hypothetical protein
VFNIRKTALDFEQQLGDYEKELKMLRVKLDAANNELECNDGGRISLSTTAMFVLLVKQTLVQSSVDNANQLNVNGQKAAAELESVKQESAAKSVQYESEIERLKQGKSVLGLCTSIVCILCRDSHSASVGQSERGDHPLVE